MKKVLKPEIRFKGFTDAWIQGKVEELFFIDTGNSKLTKQYIKQNLGKYPVYSSQTENNGIIGYINTYDFDGEFITWTQDGNAGKVFYRNGRFNASNSGILTLNFPSKYNLKFLFLALIFLDLTKLQIGGTVPHFTASMMRKVIFLIPKNKVEQEKISSIFFTLDKIVSLYQRKISVLEKLEKAFLKNMFTKKNEAKPNIRFKDFTSSWSKNKLSDWLIVKTEKNSSNNYNIYDVLSVSGEYGVVNQVKFLGRSFAGKSLTNFKISEKHTIIYTKSPLNKNPFGIIKTNKFQTGIVSTLYVVYSAKENCFPNFVEDYFNNDYRLNQYLFKLVSKGAKNTLVISDEEAISGFVSFPEYKEQKKISELLQNFSFTHAQLKRKLNLIKNIQKSVLNKMFV
ncbi:restriction endonuclease subunit S [Mesomycoplasma hyorhinis]|uniref:restriction endonuclease subunit S n=1 Tax=Mesomycoplasma hyorhinis TaxID=2100 RepID=UPI00136DF8C4|nr:restriction endonuclease subunit S [Mesomycoplasma hyorhinis]MXR11673.1 restriction endonuclease subunit S [Mesomycoplasma hyorhinis]